MERRQFTLETAGGPGAVKICIDLNRLYLPLGRPGITEFMPKKGGGSIKLPLKWKGTPDVMNKSRLGLNQVAFWAENINRLFACVDLTEVIRIQSTAITANDRLDK